MEKEQNNIFWKKKAIPTVLQSLKLGGTPSHFPNQQPDGLPTLTLLEFQLRNLLTFLLVA